MFVNFVSVIFGLSKVMVEFEGTSYFTGTREAARWAASELYRALWTKNMLINKGCTLAT